MDNLLEKDVFGKGKYTRPYYMLIIEIIYNKTQDCHKYTSLYICVCLYMLNINPHVTTKDDINPFITTILFYQINCEAVMLNKKVCMNIYNLGSSLSKSVPSVSDSVFYIHRIIQLIPNICHYICKSRMNDSWRQ